ncbi:MAG: hypothetical protein QHG99_01335 [Methanomicrobiales archaeon]|nr:hypothetical protein [Methanomicrobiales archaeon]
MSRGKMITMADEVDSVEMMGRIQRMVIEAGREVLREETRDGDWLLYIKHGSYVITLTWPAGRRFMTVVFRGEISDEGLLKRLNDLFREPHRGGTLHFALVSALTYPNTFYDILKQGDSITGFDVGALIFPFEERFSTLELHVAIQSVVNAALLGWAFIGSVLGLSDLEEHLKEGSIRTSPEGMFA